MTEIAMMQVHTAEARDELAHVDGRPGLEGVNLWPVAEPVDHDVARFEYEGGAVAEREYDNECPEGIPGFNYRG